MKFLHLGDFFPSKKRNGKKERKKEFIFLRFSFCHFLGKKKEIHRN
jgi:hypothetical protein